MLVCIYTSFQRYKMRILSFHQYFGQHLMNRLNLDIVLELDIQVNLVLVKRGPIYIHTYISSNSSKF